MSEQRLTLNDSSRLAWPDGWEQMLRGLHGEKRSAGYIARAINAEYGAGLTRNAVIGKIGRLRLQPHARPGRPTGAKAAPAKPPKEPKPQPKMFGANAGKPPAAPKPLPVLKPVETTVEPRPWLTRKFGECAFIVSGEGADAFACCAPARPSPDWCYCTLHAQRMFAKAATPAQKAAAAKAREAKRKAMAA